MEQTQESSRDHEDRVTEGGDRSLAGEEMGGTYCCLDVLALSLAFADAD